MAEIIEAQVLAVVDRGELPTVTTDGNGLTVDVRVGDGNDLVIGFPVESITAWVESLASQVSDVLATIPADDES